MTVPELFLMNNQKCVEMRSVDDQELRTALNCIFLIHLLGRSVLMVQFVTLYWLFSFLIVPAVCRYTFWVLLSCRIWHQMAYTSGRRRMVCKQGRLR